MLGGAWMCEAEASFHVIGKMSAAGLICGRLLLLLGVRIQISSGMLDCIHSLSNSGYNEYSR